MYRTGFTGKLGSGPANLTPAHPPSQTFNLSEDPAGQAVSEKKETDAVSVV